MSNQYIITGSSSKDGHILRPLEEAKACNFCKEFVGYGLHACAGFCKFKREKIEGGYTGNYRAIASTCNHFDCKLDLLATIK